MWDALERVHEYDQWWPWLDDFDGRILAAGERWSCTVHPPLPYRVRFAIDLEVVQPRKRLHAAISGDISGEARIDLSGSKGGTTLHLVADLEPERPFLRGLSWLAQPVTEFGHDQILDRALEQFATNALAEPPPDRSPS